MDELALAAILKEMATDRVAREHLRRTASTLVDGKGRVRVMEAMSAPQIMLRRAVEADCVPIWRWRNAPETRRYFFNPQPIDLASHESWFRDTLSASDRILLIAEHEQESVGVLRFDLQGDHAVVSIYVAPALAGRGLGTSMLLAGSTWLREEWPKMDFIEAQILPENSGSFRAFAAAGYVRWGQKFRRSLKTGVPA
jgi:RimJ/RimL family protein N-acetyltransferase